MKRLFQLLVFDWDGTLMDSERRIVNCVQKAILEIGAEPRNDAQVRNIIGLGLVEAIITLYPDADDRFVAKITDAYRTHFLEWDQTPSTLFAGVPEVLEELSQRGYLLAVATGKSRRGLDSVLASTGLSDRFHASRCADETFSKPHPQMLLEITTDLGVEPTDTLMIGDTEYDLQMSRNAGTDALAVSYGVHELPRLLRHDPIGYIHAFSELTEWLEENCRRSSGS